MININIHTLTNSNEGKHDMKYQEIKTLLDRHDYIADHGGQPAHDTITLVDGLREYLIYGNDGQKVIAKPTSHHPKIDDSPWEAIIECIVGQDYIEIPIEEIRSMELVVKFSDLPKQCLIINPIDEGQEEMPVNMVKLGVKGYFKTQGEVKSKDELMQMNELLYDVKYQEIVDIMLDQSIFPADADHIINHKYDSKLRLPKSEREAI